MPDNLNIDDRFQQPSGSQPLYNSLMDNDDFLDLGRNYVHTNRNHRTHSTNDNTITTLDLNIPPLIETYDLIDYKDVPGPTQRIFHDVTNAEMLDHSRSKPSIRKDYVVALIQHNITGLRFDRREKKCAEPRTVELIPGMIVRTMDETDFKKEDLENWYRDSEYSRRTNAMAVAMEELLDKFLCAMVTSNDIMRISHDEAMQLLSVNVVDRLDLYRDFERINFLMQLRIGDRVLVDVNEKMRKIPAKITSIGDRNDEPGIWYRVDFESDLPKLPTHQRSFIESLSSGVDSSRIGRDYWNSGIFDDMSGSSSVAASNSPGLYYAPNQLHMPLKGGGVPATASLYDNRRPVPGFPDYDTSYKQKPPPPKERIIPVQIRHEPAPPERERQSRQGNGYRELPPEPTQFAPSRSRSVHSMNGLRHQQHQAAQRNEHVRDEHIPFRVGDPCIWDNNGTAEKGMIKFIGNLKGHRALYAGVEFRNPIGAGTGVFNKEQLFVAKDGHAGFVELSTLDPVVSPVPSSSIPNSSSRRRLSSSSRNQHQTPASSGASVSVPVNGRHYNGQASFESLNDPLPPPAYTPPSPPRASSAASTYQQQHPPPLPPKPASRLMQEYLIEPYEIGNFVIVNHLGAQRSGIIRWLGDEMNEEGNRLERTALLEIDGDVPTAWRRKNESHYTGGVLVPVSALRNRSVAPSSQNQSYSPPSSAGSNYVNSHRRNEEFGSMDSGIEKQKCAPAKEIQQLVGRQKGIQGYCNSCYIDATLYAMFAQTTVFDFLLEKSIKNNEKAAKFQKLLAHEIVFPMRRFHYVRADHVMKLRKLLAELMPHMNGLTNEEKDPEEILAFIFSEIFKAEPFITLIGPNNQTDSQYLVPIVIDCDWQGGAATSQHLLERHLRSAQVKFVKPPPVLIMQLPRYGQQKVFDKILPLEKIDITPFVAGATPACVQCGSCAEVFCPTCFLTRRVFFTEIVFCHGCFSRTHMLPEIQDHEKEPLMIKSAKKPNLHRMALSAVLCIETSHYVAYVKTQNGQWIFFDSMADREGLSDGFNVPVVKECSDMNHWLSLSGWNTLKNADDTGQIKAMFGKTALDPLVGRLLSDSYICFYEDASTTSASSSLSSNLIANFKNMIPKTNM